MQGDTTLIVGAALFAPGAAAPLGPTEIRVTAGRIAAIEPIAADRLDPAAAGLVALPAPTNAHDHGRGLRTIAFGAADDALESWLPALAREPKSDPYLSAAVAFARMAEGGVAATNHCHSPQDRARMFEEAEAVSRAAKDVGIQVAFAVPFMNRNRGVYGDNAALLDLLSAEDRKAFVAGLPQPTPIGDMLAMVERISALEHDLFRVQYGPIGPQWVSDDALVRLARASAETGRRIHMHLFETERQRDWADSAYPQGLINFLDGIGFLSPRLTVAHGVWLRPHECARLSERGVTVAVNISSNLRLRSGIPPVRTFRELGLRFGIGLDASSFDDDEDILREIRLVWQSGRRFSRSEVLSRGDLFEAATVHGRATVVGGDGGGRLEIGAPADIAVLDLAAMSDDLITPHFDIADLLLTRMAKRHLRRLIVGGRTIVADGRCVSVDRPALERALRAAAKAGRAAAPPDDWRIARLQQAIAAYYRAGLHKRPPKEAPPPDGAAPG
jgi:cytosine/adenosine deaminase-related metal-dependent hydrolase